ncbi:hypothetical protein ACHAXT_013002 [Thalassiosira profunda]
MALRKHQRCGRPVEIDGVSSPAEVTSKLLASLLNTHYDTSTSVEGDASAEGGIKVASMQWTPLGRGVMSDVQLLDVSYESTCEAGNIPSRFLAKFKKEEIPLRDLFTVEGRFYRFASKMKSAEGENDGSGFPFRLVDAVAFGPSWILLEYISAEDDMDIIDVHEGCPSERFDDLLVRLARIHATCWISDDAEISSKPAPAISSLLRKYACKLSPAPGAGHTLPPSGRQQQFAPGWPAVRERMMPYFQSEYGTQSLEKMDEIVSWTSQSSRIADIARSVAEKKCTLVHGDFHIGNMLLEKTQHEDSGERKQPAPWLVDWSMAGVGNPCVDLVFFLILAAEAIPTYEMSTEGASLQSTTEMTTERVGRILKQYYQTLTAGEQDEDTANTPLPSNRTQQPRLQWEAFLSMFSECLLNQFIILVCYDSLCRSMADASPDGPTFHHHFDRVNVRCARMLLSEFGIPRLMSERMNSSNQ